MKFKAEDLAGINFQKIGGWATVVAVAMITYYTLSTYKTLLEIKQIKNDLNGNSN